MSRTTQELRTLIVQGLHGCDPTSYHRHRDQRRWRSVAAAIGSSSRRRFRTFRTAIRSCSFHQLLPAAKGDCDMPTPPMLKPTTARSETFAGVSYALEG